MSNLFWIHACSSMLSNISYIIILNYIQKVVQFFSDLYQISLATVTIYFTYLSSSSPVGHKATTMFRHKVLSLAEA